ncbi:pyridoxine 5'-phosphate oxidase [Legionella beliardensis]|uniref:Pyridoxine/pyridoxamine 5'-phosphate oxidase n=1 Tax=Legionella beliardensis TaxID=91822 RepID=A0A378I4U6_9GAMM|nr:pyridoxamine 5'-phosphate oxidase [Legionella beliardensis]STX30033.1 pyridoxine 5'-phosphate oxidase [Legionella beliardensis]
MTDWPTIAGIRREYGNLNLDDNSIEQDPFILFKSWFEEILKVEKSDPTAMVLSTVDTQGHPDSRVVLLKGIENGAFIFFTNYESNKARQLKYMPYAALNFYWPQMARQIRIRGAVEKTTATQSDAYFVTRPLESQLSAIASPQSRPVQDRQTLEASFKRIESLYQQQQQVTRPDYWGGYCLIPNEIEFWQGRDKRLHDRLQYYKDSSNEWLHQRLAP